MASEDEHDGGSSHGDFEEDSMVLKILIAATAAGSIIGKGGSALKKVGTRARGRMEKFFAKRVYLETRVKVRPSWRSSESDLADFGYL